MTDAIATVGSGGRSRGLVSVVFALCLAAAAGAEGLPAGIDPGAELTVDAFRVVRGGDAVGTAFMGKVTLTADYDSAAAGRREGTRMRLNLLGTFGDSLSEKAGDLQVVSNIEAPDDVRVFEAWVEQSLGPHASILAGWNDFNAEFDVATMAAGLLNSSFGVGPDISQVGPSIFPRSHPGVRLRAASGSGAYAIAGGWHGVPFPEVDPVSGDEVEGTFGSVEAGWTRESSGRLGSPKLAAGFWRLKARGSGIADEADAVGGYYALAEAEVEIAGGARLGAFVRAGRALDDSREIRSYAGAGVRVASIARSRPDDEIAFGVARAELSPASASAVGASAETTWELNWRIQLNGRLAFVPDFQYVDSPAGSESARSALVVGVRTVITLD